jgi:drug/metabolite transporter (DMT)-like permease
MTPRTATLIGLTAILMWSLLSVLTVATGKIPAFQLAAMTFAIGALVAFASFLFRPSAFGALKQPLVAWVVGVGGLFGYHALYFLALRFAPPAEAGLLNYLWPLLIVLFSSLLPGERLAPHHIIGALLGLGGTVLLFAGNGASFAPGQIPGLAAAFVAAFVWAAYSVMSRKLKAVHETRRHPRARCSFLRDAFTLDRISNSGGLCAADGDDRDCRDPGRGRRIDCGEGYGVEEVGWARRSVPTIYLHMHV